MPTPSHLSVLLRATLLFFMSLSSTLQAANATQDIVYPRSWYFSLNAEICAKIKKIFEQDPRFEKLTLQEGLYFQDLRKTSDLSQISNGTLLDAASFEPSSSGGEAHIGFYRKGFNDPEELWLITGSAQSKFLLGTYFPDQNRWELNRLAAESKYWFPVKGGILQFNNNWLVTERPNDPKQKEIPLAYTKRDGSITQIRAHARELQRGLGETPVYAYDGQLNKLAILFTPDDTGTAQGIVQNFPNTVQVAMIDLNTRKVSVVPQTYEWPMAMNYRGIYYSESKAGKKVLYYQKFDWFKDALDKKQPEPLYAFGPRDQMVSVGSQFHILRPDSKQVPQKYTVNFQGKLSRFLGDEDKFHENEPEELEVFKTYLDSTDLKDELQTGKRIPVYESEEQSKKLANSLGNGKDTWVILKYDEGQLPEETVASFIWRLETGTIDATEDLRQVQQVFDVPGSFFDTLTDDKKVAERIDELRKLVEEKKAILFLRDFPATKKFEATRGNAAKKMEIFEKSFRPCLRNGTCRVVMTIRSEVYKEIDEQLEQVFENAQLSPSPKVDDEQRAIVAMNVKNNLQSHRKINRIMSDDAFKAFLKFSDDLGRRKESPGNEVEILERLFDYIDTNHPNEAEIDRLAFQQWADHVRGLDTLQKNLDIDGLRVYLKDMMVSHDKVIDDVCDTLDAVRSGIKFNRGPLAHFTFIGTTGTGKTYISELLANYLTPRDPLLKIDMSSFKGFGPKDPVFKELKASKDKVRVVLFDDIDQIGGDKALMDKLAAIIDEGVYGEGSEDRLDFSNTIVIWTSNWAEQLIRRSSASSEGIRNQLRRELTVAQGDNEPLIRPRIWGRIESSLYVMYPFTKAQWFELALTMSRNYAKRLFERKSINLKVDPEILLEVIAEEEEAQAGARSILHRLEERVFSKFAKEIKQGVTDIVVIQSGTDYLVKTNLSADGFKEAWAAVPDISKWKEADIQKFIDDFNNGK